MSDLHVLDECETTAAVVAGKSLTRFNDGELGYAYRGWAHRHQPLNSGLIRRLKEVFESRVDNLLIAVPRVVGIDPYRDALPSIPRFWRGWEGWCKEHFDRRTYGSGFVSYPDRHLVPADWDAYRSQWEQVWENREVVLIGNPTDCFGDTQSAVILSSATRVHFIPSPPVDAWAQRNAIMRQAKGYAKSHLQLIACGIAGTVLAHDLCIEGYQAVDIGRLLLRFQLIEAKENAETHEPE